MPPQARTEALKGILLAMGHRKQQTLRRAVAVDGVGYWTGSNVRVEFRPAPVNTGVVFVRAVTGETHRIPVSVENLVEVPRRTSLFRGPARVEMIEHIMATLSGLRVDNCEVWMDASEAPGCDGSSLAFLEAIQSAGVRTQLAERNQLVIDRTIRIGDENVWIQAEPMREEQLVVRYELDYGPGPIHACNFEIELTPETFATQLAPARTFLLEEEAEQLRSQGLAQHVTYQDLLVFNDSGPIDNVLRFDDECVRHKALDVVGDLALAGCDIVGRITAHRSGHRLNAKLVAALLASHSRKQMGAA